jgi:hypothetical protein
MDGLVLVLIEWLVVNDDMICLKLKQSLFIISALWSLEAERIAKILVGILHTSSVKLNYIETMGRAKNTQIDKFNFVICNWSIT